MKWQKKPEGGTDITYHRAVNFAYEIKDLLKVSSLLFGTMTLWLLGFKFKPLGLLLLWNFSSWEQRKILTHCLHSFEGYSNLYLEVQQFPLSTLINTHVSYTKNRMVQWVTMCVMSFINNRNKNKSGPNTDLYSR